MASMKYRNNKGEMIKIPKYTMISDAKIRGQVYEFMEENLEKEIGNGLVNYMKTDTTLVRAEDFNNRINTFLTDNIKLIKEEYVQITDADMLETGSISKTTGALEDSSTTSYRTVHYYPVGVSGELMYSGSAMSGVWLRPVFYDKDYNFIKNTQAIQCNNTNAIFNVPDKAKYFKLVIAYATLTKIISAKMSFLVNSNVTASTLEKINEKINRNTVYVYDVMPTDETLMSLPDNTIFSTLGYYTVNDGQGSTYKITTEYAFNCQLKQSFDSEGNVLETRRLIDIGVEKNQKNIINLAHFGLKGIEYTTDTDLDEDTIVEIGNINDAVISSIKNIYTIGMSFYIPSGYWVFNTPIDLTAIGNQISLIGDGTNPRDYAVHTSATNIIFRNLKTNDVAINGSLGTLKDIAILGSAKQYNISFDRTKFISSPDEVITEVNQVQATGIKWNSGIINNVSVRYFYIGLYTPRSNTYINNFYARRCHYAVKTENDNKYVGIYGWNVHTMFYATGALVSVSMLRVDSCVHVLELKNASAFACEDADGDWCTSSLLRVSGTCRTARILNLKGRCNTLRAQLATEIQKVASDLTDGDCEGYGLIYMEKGASLLDSTIMMSSGGSNPQDAATGYFTPKILLVASTNTTVDGLELDVVDSSFTATEEYFTNTVYKNTTTKPWQMIVKNARGVVAAHCNGAEDSILTISTLDYLKLLN